MGMTKRKPMKTRERNILRKVKASDPIDWRMIYDPMNWMMMMMEHGPMKTRNDPIWKICLPRRRRKDYDPILSRMTKAWE